MYKEVADVLVPSKPKKQADRPRLYLVRHGHTAGNEGNLFRGWTNYELDGEGRLQAEKAGKFLKGKGIKKVAYSTLERDDETADIIQEILGIPQEDCIEDDRLRPWNTGYLTGQKQDEEHKAELADFRNHPDVRIPEGESLNHFSGRLLEAMEEYAKKGNMLVVGHSSTLIQLALHAQGLDHNANPDKVTIVGPGGVMALHKKALIPLTGEAKKGKYGAK